MNATDMVQGNLALKLETPAAPAFTVVKGGRSGFQTLPGKPVRSQCVATTSAPVALKAAYAESASNVTYETVRVQSGDSLWSLAQEHSVDGLTTQETSDIIRSVNHLEHGSLDAGDVLKVPARS